MPIAQAAMICGHMRAKERDECEGFGTWRGILWLGPRRRVKANAPGLQESRPPLMHLGCRSAFSRSKALCGTPMTWDPELR
jgi:hypothetical protein